MSVSHIQTRHGCDFLLFFPRKFLMSFMMSVTGRYGGNQGAVSKKLRDVLSGRNQEILRWRCKEHSFGSYQRYPAIVDFNRSPAVEKTEQKYLLKVKDLKSPSDWIGLTSYENN